MALTSEDLKALGSPTNTLSVANPQSTWNPNAIAQKVITSPQTSNTSTDQTPSSSSPQNLFGNSWFGKGLNSLTTSEQAVGNDLTAGVRANMETGNEDKINAADNEYIQTLHSLMSKATTEGKTDLAAKYSNQLKTALNSSNSFSGFQQAVPESTKTNEQGIGDVIGTGVDALAPGGLSAAAYGAVKGAAQGMSNNQGVGGVALDAAIGLASGKVLEMGFQKAAPYITDALQKYGTPAFEKLSQFIPEGAQAAMKDLATKASENVTAGSSEGGTKILNKVSDAIDNPTDKVINKVGDVINSVGNSGGATVTSGNSSITDSLNKTRLEPNKATIQDTLRQTKASEPLVSRQGTLGKTVLKATPREVEVAQAAHPYVSNSNDWVDHINNLNQGIEDFAQKEVRPALRENPGDFKDVQDYKGKLSTYMDQNHNIPEYVKSNPQDAAAYNKTFNRVKNNYLGMVKDGSNEGGWNASIKFDKFYDSELDKAPVGSVQRQNLYNAVQEVRRMGRDFIADNSGDANFANNMKKFTKLYEARDNIIENNWRNVGETKLREYIDSHPALKFGEQIGRSTLRRIPAYGVFKALRSVKI